MDVIAIGNRYLDPFGKIQVISNIDENGTIYFQNSSVRATTEKFWTYYKPDMSGMQQPQSRNSVNESISYGNSEDTVVDPNIFMQRNSNAFGAAFDNAVAGVDVNQLGNGMPRGNYNPNTGGFSQMTEPTIKPFNPTENLTSISSQGDMEFEALKQKKIQEAARNSANNRANLSLDENAITDEAISNRFKSEKAKAPNPEMQKAPMPQMSNQQYDYNPNPNQGQPQHQHQPQQYYQSDSNLTYANIKRNEIFEFVVTVKDKIPNKEFIKIWEESYEGSLMDYLATDILNRVIHDPTILLAEIKRQLNAVVFGKPKRKTKAKPKKKPVASASTAPAKKTTSTTTTTKAAPKAPIKKTTTTKKKVPVVKVKEEVA